MTTIALGIFLPSRRERELFNDVPFFFFLPFVLDYCLLFASLKFLGYKKGQYQTPFTI